MSARSGPLTGLPWLAAAIAVWLSTEDTFPAGLMVGAAYTLGCALCVVVQYMLAGSIANIDRPRPTRGDVLTYLSDGGLYFIGEFPSQFYGRVLILIVTASLGHHAAGAYVYIRQLLSGFGQIISLIKRVEFPRLSMALRAPLRFRHLIAAQSVNLSVAVAVFAGAVIAYCVRDSLSPRFAEIAYYFVFFAFALPIWALAGTFGQALILKDGMKTYSVVMLGGIVVSAVATTAFTGTFGLAFIAWCDIVIFIVQTVVFARVTYRSENVATVR